MEKTITLILTEEDVSALYNAAAVFGNEVFSISLGLPSWLKDKLEQIYPNYSEEEIEEILINQIGRISNLLDQADKQLRPITEEDLELIRKVVAELDASK